MVIDLYYGLGNQMFIYAFGQYCKIIKGMDVRYNIEGFHKNTDKVKREPDICMFPNVTLPKDEWIYQPNFHTYHVLKDYIGKHVYLFLKGYSIKRELIYRQFDNELVSNLCEKDYVFGFFQTEDYINFLEEQVRRDYMFSPQMPPKTRAYYEMIKSRNAVSLHVRRGDYVNDPNFNTLEKDYYENAIKLMEQHTESPTFFVFSDDIGYVKNELMPPLNSNRCIFVEGNSGYDDMRLMSNCKHHIMANSSFSWWGAWLNPNPSKVVIAPTSKRWYKNPLWYQKDSHYLPQQWIRI